MVQGTDGSFYGTTLAGGANGNGTVFKITLEGTLATLTTLHSFDGTDGSGPNSLVRAADGAFYGTTLLGPPANLGQGCGNGCGTIFKIAPRGALTTLYSFDGTDWMEPYWLVEATNGNFYGLVVSVSGSTNPYGAIFEMTPGGTVTILVTYNGSNQGWAYPNQMIRATNGDFYGTTSAGGASTNCPGVPSGCGTVFKMTPGGTLTTLHSFDGTDGYGAEDLLQAFDGNFYGTTLQGGANACPPFTGCGTFFKITPEGTLTTLYNVEPSLGYANGFALSWLVQGSDRNFYGATRSGTFFRITPEGTLTTYSLTVGGTTPSGLLQATDGSFYGTTEGGGTNGDGTVFSLSVGLDPFVNTLPTSGKVGAAVKILGTNLTGTTSVTFDGTAAVFEVKSSSLITTTVPATATTGKVEVTTPSGVLSSNAAFLVRP
jgi:uncharacterized repeat protein (TIGR03803 family)